MSNVCALGKVMRHLFGTAIVLLMICLAITPGAAYWDGVSTDTSWYSASQTSFTLHTEEELAGFALLVNDGNDFSGKTIYLGNDLNFAKSNGDKNIWTQIGLEESRQSTLFTYSFSGVFDGKNHVISNIYVNNDGLSSGFFGLCSGATIKNLKLLNLDVVGDKYVGGLVGHNYLWNYPSTITNCHVQGNVSGVTWVGGLIGFNEDSSSVEYCSFNGNVVTTGFIGTYPIAGGLIGYNVYVGYGGYENRISYCYSSGSVVGIAGDVGGLIGGNDESTILNSFSTSNVKCTSSNGGSAGGLVGDNYKGTINNCYSTGDITNDGDRVGGLVGWNRFGDIDHCYSVGAVSGEERVGGVIGENIGSAKYLVALNPSVSGSEDVHCVVGLNNEDSTLTYTYSWDGMVGGGSDSLLDGTKKITKDIWGQEAGSGIWSSAGFYSSNWKLNPNVPGYQLIILKWQAEPLLLSISHFDPEPIYWNGGSDISWYSESQDSFTISTIEELAGLAELVNNEKITFAGKTINLDSNLDFANVNTGNLAWVPIGRYDDYSGIYFPFSGLFNGNNHTISNIPFTSATGFGLFGYTEDATIKNLGILDIDVMDIDSGGGLVTTLNRGSVSNCYSTGNIDIEDNEGGTVGGLVGTAFSDSSVSFSYSTVNINGASTVGGLIGCSTSTSTINCCYATGNVSGSYCTGGLIGDADGCITNCYATGSVDGGGYYGGGTGGIAGELYNSNSKILNCYATGSIDGYYVGSIVGICPYGTVQNCVALNPSLDGATDYTHSIVGDDYYEYGGNPSLKNNYAWDGIIGIQPDYYNPISNGKLVDTYEIWNNLSGVWSVAGFSSEIWKLNDDVSQYGLPILSWQSEVPKTDVSYLMPPVLWDGNGTKDEPFLIYTIEDLKRIGTNLNGGESYSGTYFKLMNNLDLSSVCNPTSGCSWEPIGDYDVGIRFAGTFDGDGHVISNLYIYNPQDSSIGLFGYNIGTIKNLYFTNANVTGNEYVGAIVGYNSGIVSNCHSFDCQISSDIDYYCYGIGGLVGYTNKGTIRDCTSSGSVSGMNVVGGLVGATGFSDSILNCSSSCRISGLRDWTNNVIGKFLGGLIGSVSHSTVSNCSATGDVVGSGYVGGLFGSTGWSTISNCYATGDVVGSSYVGGFVGENDGWDGNIINSYATGDVIGSQYVGGFAGKNYEGKITSCFSTGLVSGDESSTSLGGLVGWNTDGGEISNCYSSSTVRGGTYVGGIAGYNDGYYGNKASVISKCYSVGIVDGLDHVGGILGRNYDVTLSDSIALNPEISGTNHIHRIVGSNTGTLSKNYVWDGMIGGGFDTVLDGLVLQSNTIQNNQSIFQNILWWDFRNTWKMNEGNGRYQLPVLQFQETPVSGDASYFPASAPTFTPSESLPEGTTITTNTVADMNANKKAEVGYQISPDKITEIKAPTITRGVLSATLNDAVKVMKKLSDGTEEEVDAKVNEDGTVTITGSLDDAASVTVNFIGRQFGDTLGNGKVGAVSALKIAQNIVGLDSGKMSDTDKFYGDVNGDGSIKVVDALMIAQYTVGILDENYIRVA